MSDQRDPDIISQALLYVTSIGTWVAGEAGRAAIAGAAGGFTRWLISERRRLSEGIVSTLVGLVMSLYASPIMLALIRKWIGDISGDTKGAAGFAAGLMGMSIAKMALAILDRRTNGDGDGRHQ